MPSLIGSRASAAGHSISALPKYQLRCSSYSSPLDSLACWARELEFDVRDGRAPAGCSASEETRLSVISIASLSALYVNITWPRPGVLTAKSTSFCAEGLACVCLRETN